MNSKNAIPDYLLFGLGMRPNVSYITIFLPQLSVSVDSLSLHSFNVSCDTVDPIHI